MERNSTLLHPLLVLSLMTHVLLQWLLSTQLGVRRTALFLSPSVLFMEPLAFASQEFVESVAIPFRPLDNEIWFNKYVMEPFLCLAPPPPMGVLMKKYWFLVVKPKQIFWNGRKETKFYHTVMSKDSTRRRRTIGSQASREKRKNKLHARRMKAGHGASIPTVLTAAAPSSVIDPAPPAVDQKELLGSGYEQCPSTGRIVRFSRRQRAKALA